MKMEMIRQDVNAAVRPVPTDNSLAVLPMTGDRFGVDPDRVEAGATYVSSTADAFEKFKPEVHVREEIEGAELGVDLTFERLRDFDVDQILTAKPGQRNDAADLQARIELLQQLRARFAQAKVKRAWADETKRAQVIDAVKMFHAEISRIAKGGNS